MSDKISKQQDAFIARRSARRGEWGSSIEAGSKADSTGVALGAGRMGVAASRNDVVPPLLAEGTRIRSLAPGPSEVKTFTDTDQAPGAPASSMITLPPGMEVRPITGDNLLPPNVWDPPAN